MAMERKGADLEDLFVFENTIFIESVQRLRVVLQRPLSNWNGVVGLQLD